MKTKKFETILVNSADESIAILTLNRPHAANAFNTRMTQELYQYFEQVATDCYDLRCIVVTGSGERAFCAGADLKERKKMDENQWLSQHLGIERMARAIRDCPVPTIGAINGAAYGGGCEIACLLDFIYACKTAVFALPETGIGIIPGAGGTQTLARAIGERQALEAILTAAPFTADQACQWGLVNQICPAAELVPAVLETARKIAANAPIAVRQAKQSVRKGLQMSLSDAMAFEIEAYYRTIPTQDRREGVLAFNEKRTPQFQGR